MQGAPFNQTDRPRDRSLRAWALLLLGWRVREALLGLGGVLAVVTFGHLLAPPLYASNEHVVPRGARVFLLLDLPRSDDRFALDAWLRARRGPDPAG